MMYAVDEINHSTTLLPGVKVGYRIFDSCGRPPWALQAVLSLVGGDAVRCASVNGSATAGSDEQVNLMKGIFM